MVLCDYEKHIVSPDTTRATRRISPARDLCWGTGVTGHVKGLCRATPWAWRGCDRVKGGVSHAGSTLCQSEDHTSDMTVLKMAVLSKCCCWWLAILAEGGVAGIARGISYESLVQGEGKMKRAAAGHRRY